ncbi:alpha/beta fold hydrolase [Mycobacterium sp.]|uniref:alpha/beta fold hydrolase n=1 Tax=Mycobacterium sp. TaxID=1785 RepID=UPI002DAAA0DC|nr:alpha/beta hydrolase [Mycobacterium sp.]
MKLRIATIAVVVVVLALLVNAFLVDRTERSAEAFAGGRVLELDGPDLNVREYGGSSGDRAVVLLHGYSASIEWWEKIAPALADSGQRVVAIDLVGHGGSEAPRDVEPYGVAGQATAVRSALGALGVRRAVLVGHSMGGHIATAVAESDPDLVERIVVSDTPADQGLTDMPVLGSLGCWPLIGPAIDRFRGVDALTNSSLQTGFASEYPVPQLAHRSLEQLTHQGVCYSGTDDNERAVADRLAGMGKPVLVVWGEHDVLTPTAPNVERYGAAGLDRRVIAVSGHSPMVETPGAFVAAITDFIRPDR